MFRLKFNDAPVLRDLLTALSVLSDEATLVVEPERLWLRQMDPSRVAMVDFEMPKTAADEYECAKTEKMGLNLNELLKLLKRAAKGDAVEIATDASGKLAVTITGKYTRSFTMPVLDLSGEEVPTPKLSLNAKATLTSEGLKQIVEDAELVSDCMRIEAAEDGLKFCAAGDILGATIEVPKNSETLLELSVKEPSKAVYSLNYLLEISKAVAAEVVTMEFSTDLPLRLDFKQPKETRLTFYLAPRIEPQ